MAKPFVKAEPRLEADHAFSFTAPGGGGKVDASASKEYSTKLTLGCEWKQCNGKERLTQVKIKEQAVKDGMQFLQRLMTTLKEHVLLNKSCQPRIEKIDIIRNRKQEPKALVGFLGVTGAGKSSLINALLGHKDLLPISCREACTATVVEISYNKHSDPGSTYRAEVIYFTVEEWRNELQQLLEHLRAKAAAADSPDGDNPYEQDFEREKYIKATFAKVQVVYPNIKLTDAFEAAKISELLSHPNVRNVLGKTNSIGLSRRREFAAAIKPYINTSSKTMDGSTFTHWPLVKLVKVFIKAEILEPGITLVDLPGTMDSNAARSVVAENYLKELSVTCIVASAHRGISEQSAQELLEKCTKRQLQLDGLFKAESLCFILSKTDNLDDVDEVNRYLSDNDDLRESCSSDIDEEAKYHREIRELETEVKKIDRSLLRHKRVLSLRQTERESMSHHNRCTSSDNTPSQQKRKRGADALSSDPDSQPSHASPKQIARRDKLSALQNEIAALRNSIDEESKKITSFERRIKNKKKSKSWAYSRQTVACIKHRNDYSCTAIRKDYQETLQEMGREVTTPLQVFPVAASIHHSFQTRGRTCDYPGFPTSAATGIGALRNWLNSTTLDSRDRNAQAFLVDVESFCIEMLPWANNEHGDMKMSAEVRALWDKDLNAKIGSLNEHFQELSLNTRNTIQHFVLTDFSSKLHQIELAACSKSLKTVKKWGKMHWSTHRAVNRSCGDWVDSKRNAHKWNDDLVHDFTTPMLRHWDSTFYNKLPTQQQLYIEEGQKLIDEFAEKAQEHCMSTDVGDGVDIFVQHVLRSKNLLQSQATICFEDITIALRAVHRSAKPKIKKFLGPMYAKCAANGGTGHYTQNRNTHLDQISTRGVAMHHKGGRAIKAAADELVESLPDRLRLGWEAVLVEINQGKETFFEQNSSTGVRNTSRKSVSVKKKILVERLKTDFDSLDRAWSSKVDLTAPQMEYPSSDDETDFSDAGLSGLGELEDEDEDEDWGDDADESMDDDY